MRPFKNNRGIAIITAILALAFMTYLATEVTYDATVEYVVNAQELKRLKAYYAARAGLEISLLRIKAYQQIVQKLGKNASNYPMVNMIWNFPLQWPLEIPEKLGLMSKDDFKEANESSYFDANFSTVISDEGSKIDLNDLVSPSKVLKDNTRRQLLNLFTQHLESDKRFEEKYRNFRFEELINQMTDFMSQQRASLNGGDKSAVYNGTDYEGYPPNRGYRTVAELRVLPMMEDELFKLIEGKVTTFGLKGINPNMASKEILMSLDIGITSEIADKIIHRRETQTEGGPFKTPEEFWAAVNQFGARLVTKPEEIPIVTDALISFHVKSTGVYSNVKSDIEVIVTDLNRTATVVSDYVKKEPGHEPPPTYDAAGHPVPPPTPPPPQPVPIPPGPPRIMNWVEY